MAASLYSCRYSIVWREKGGFIGKTFSNFWDTFGASILVMLRGTKKITAIAEEKGDFNLKI